MDTPPAFAGKIVRVNLANGTKIEGSWISVTDQDFTIKTLKNSAGYPADTTRIVPRASIRGIALRKIRLRGRLWGTFAGFFGPPLIGAAFTKPGDSNQGLGFLALVGGVSGYLIGSHFDHHYTERIRLIDP